MGVWSSIRGWRKKPSHLVRKIYPNTLSIFEEKVEEMNILYGISRSGFSKSRERIPPYNINISDALTKASSRSTALSHRLALRS